MVQYNAALIITGAFKGTSRDKIYQELGLESLADRRWTRKLIFFHKIILGLLPSYLKDYLIPCDNLRTYLTWSSTQKRIKTFSARTKTFQSSYSINTCKSSILNFVRPRENSAFEVHGIKGVKLLTRILVTLMNINFDITLMVQSILLFPAVKNLKHLSTTSCVMTFIRFSNEHSLMMFVI